MNRESAPVFSVHGVRYQVTDVARASAFYTERFGLKLERQHLPAFASVSLGEFVLLLSGRGIWIKPRSMRRSIRPRPQRFCSLSSHARLISRTR
jgi:catechol 2,3-dioxygenase-like lactoylglutathione lyase family enzyme